MGQLRAYRKKKQGRRRTAAKPLPLPMRIIANVGVFCLMLLIGLTALTAHYARDLPDTRSLWRNDDARRITLLSQDGAPISMHGASSGEPVRLAELPPHVSAAVLAVEDRNFYHHAGFNLLSIGRAMLVNAKDGAVRQGGSTITQQLAKNLFLNSDRTMKRKAQELLLALWLERKFTKDEILTLYLNRVYFGAGAYGIDAASYRYFDKSARGLSVGEAAVLAGLLKAPSRLAPNTNPQTAGRRARLVIDQMVETGALTPEQAVRWIAEPVRLRAEPPNAAPYFVDHVMREVDRLAGEVDADLVVRTTFDRAAQEAADTGLIAGLSQDAALLNDAQAAVVILDQEGAVRAMIGGRDYRESQFNRAAQARRQPGSAFKPIVYLAAVKRGARSDDIVLDAPLTIGEWSPQNYRQKYFGEVTLRESLARSLNSAAIRVQEATGRAHVRATANALGLTGPLNQGPALALGVDAISPLELAGAYAAFANGGYRVEPFCILSIETSDGAVVYRSTGSIRDHAASTTEIAELNMMLNAVTAWGSGQAARLEGRMVYGKTGTTQNSRDAWFAGHAEGLTTVVWLGKDDNAPMLGVAGAGAPAIIWREVMARALPPAWVSSLSGADGALLELTQPGG